MKTLKAVIAWILLFVVSTISGIPLSWETSPSKKFLQAKQSMGVVLLLC